MNNHMKLIMSSGGEVIHEYFVKTPGIMITQTSKPSDEFMILSEIMNLDINRPNYEIHGELNSRITYMSFPLEKTCAKDYNDKMINEYKHLSVYNDHHISILIAGISIEASQEIVAHNEASVARLTSSKTLAQSNPLFVLNESYDIDKQIEFINRSKELRQEYIKDNNEFNNMMFSCSKAISIVATMSLKNWHKTLIGRLSHNGVEREVQNIMIKICTLLNERYPLIIKTPDDYYIMNNGVKYES